MLEKRRLLREIAQLNAVEEDAEEEEQLITVADAVELVGGGEAPLVIPSGFSAVAEAPSAEQLDPFHTASEELLNKVLLVRIEGYGWCHGVILKQVPNRTRKIGGVQVNFIAKFDVDEFPTDLALEAKDYDTSFSASYESWMLLESSEQPTAMDEE